MYIYQPELQMLLLFLEVIAAIVAVFYYKTLKNTHWVWLVMYLVYVGIQEVYFRYYDSLFGISKQDYYNYFGIPLEYLFLFWLYAVKSIKNKKLFWIFGLLTLTTILPIIYENLSSVIHSLTTTVGSFFLIILVTLEFYKQIIEDNILEFRNNKMFYINIGVLLFYVANVPFMGLYSFFLNEPNYWNKYYLYFVSSNCILYILYILSFLCGKKN